MADELVERDGVVGVELDPEEAAELEAQIAGLPEEEARGELRPVDELIAELRAMGQRRAG